MFTSGTITDVVSDSISTGAASTSMPRSPSASSVSLTWQPAATIRDNPKTSARLRIAHLLLGAPCWQIADRTLPPLNLGSNLPGRECGRMHIYVALAVSHQHEQGIHIDGGIFRGG